MKPGPALVGVLSAILVGLLVTLGGLEEGAPAEDLGTGQMFNRIARRYDLANKFMSLGMDQGWRRGLVAALELAPSDRVLDLATGTADVAILEGAAGPAVLGVDPSANMLAIGRTKVAAAGLDGTVELALGDATDLEHLADGGFDKISISFGIRNIPDVDGARRCAARALGVNSSPPSKVERAPSRRTAVPHAAALCAADAAEAASRPRGASRADLAEPRRAVPT
ncbi:2-octaprenyl-6-methoxy-1,4-benzoquinone methylase [Aureococcus anophagefferens]|nr:2-octaprenyl-6-methoxy-1,4-benzoquinone methylase [Aureococcus anophagefferens]